MKSRVAVVCASPLVAIFAFNCSVPSFCEGSECGSVDGGGDGDVVVGPHDASSDGPVTDGSKLPDGAMSDGATEAGPPVCDKSADPKDSPACVVDGDGIFVDAAGLDTNAGTKEAPVKSITKAVALAQGGVGRVYVCAGSYSETVTLTAAVSVYGGFACGTYAYSGVLPVVTAAVGKSALSITGVTGVALEDMQFVSVDATGTDASGNGNSSIAAFISSSTGVTIKRSTFKAGAGAAAVAGATTGTVYTTPAQAGKQGTASAGGAALGPFTCTNSSGKTSSGKGGDPSSGGSGGTMGSADPAISPVSPTGDDGAPGGLNCGTAAAHGGSYGVGGGGGLAATSAGSLTASAWQPSTGGAGAVGGVGEGGGGGGSTDTSGGGGSGSLGGCGGDAGQGGAGGGGSLGLAVYQSSLTLVASTLQASAGGGGGSGSKGGTGQNVSLGGAPGSSAACNGAVGGLGGSGGGGAGGSGGISAGIVWTGTAPTVDGTVTNNATSLAGITVASTPAGGGGAGAAGDPVTGAARGGQTGAVGLSGVAQAVLGL
jgi:hypothetical protein